MNILESYSFHTFLLDEGNSFNALVFFLKNTFTCLKMLKKCSFVVENHSFELNRPHLCQYTDEILRS